MTAHAGAKYRGEHPVVSLEHGVEFGAVGPPGPAQEQRADRRLELIARLREQRVRLGPGNTEHRRDLRDVQPVPHHHHDVALGGVQAVERRAKHRPQLPLLTGGQDRGGIAQPRPLVDGRRHPGRPQPTQALAAGNRVQPGPQPPERAQHLKPG